MGRSQLACSTEQVMVSKFEAPGTSLEYVNAVLAVSLLFDVKGLCLHWIAISQTGNLCTVRTYVYEYVSPAQEQAVAQILVPVATIPTTITTFTATTTTPTICMTTSTNGEVFLDNLPPELFELQ